MEKLHMIYLFKVFRLGEKYMPTNKYNQIWISESIQHFYFCPTPLEKGQECGAVKDIYELCGYNSMRKRATSFKLWIMITENEDKQKQ